MIVDGEAPRGLVIRIPHSREEHLQSVIALLVVQTLLLPRHLGRQSQRLVAGDAHVVCHCHPRVQRPHVGPRHHIHRCCAAGVHRHVGKQTVVIEVVVQRQVVPGLKRCRQQAIDARRPAVARHVHVDWHVGSRRVIHNVGNVVIVCLRFPARLAKKVLVRQRRDDTFGLRHIHVQSRIAHIGSTVEDECRLQHVPRGQSQSGIGKHVYLPELRKPQFVATARLVVVGMTIESACVEVRPVTT